jgi:aminoglycoside 2'-N-acetyltransferase I
MCTEGFNRGPVQAAGRHHGGVADIRVLATADVPADLLAAIRRLLDASFGGDFSDDDWKHALGGWHVVAVEDGVPIAHASVVPRLLEIGGDPFECGYVEGVATAPGQQGKGNGSMVITHLNALIGDHFRIGALSTGRHAFFERLGWERWRGPTFVRRGHDRVRTPDEDAGIMVLRLGSSLDVDLTQPIVCESRSGDDW